MGDQRQNAPCPTCGGMCPETARDAEPAWTVQNCGLVATHRGAVDDIYIVGGGGGGALDRGMAGGGGGRRCACRFLVHYYSGGGGGR